jgi:hypothetical protein
MPQIMDMSLLHAATMATSEPWATLTGKAEQAQEAFTSGILARQRTDSALGSALSPIFTAAGSVLSGLAQSGVQSLFGTGSTGSFLGSGSPTTQSLYPGLDSQMAKTSAGMEAMRSTMGFG